MTARLAPICVSETPARGTSVRYLASTSSQAIPRAAAPFGSNTVLVLVRPSLVRRSDAPRRRLPPGGAVAPPASRRAADERCRPARRRQERFRAVVAGGVGD